MNGFDGEEAKADGKPALKWKPIGKQYWTAPDGKGEQYTVGTGFTMGSSKTYYYADHGKPGGPNLRNLGKAPTADAAKALAQTDYDKQQG